MGIDWASLNEKTQGYRTLRVSKDPVSGEIVETLFCGLEVKLSELVSGFSFGGSSALMVYADTLVIDAPSFDAQGTVVAARSVDATALEGSPFPVRVPPAGGTAVVEAMIGEVAGGPLALTTTIASGAAPGFVVPTGTAPLQTVLFTVADDGTVKSQVKSDPADVSDLVGRPFGLNSLRASLTAAAWLMDSSDEGDVATAASMLEWVVSCVPSCGPGLPAAFLDVYHQAAALLVSLNVSPGTYYVPVLSSAFYKDHANGLLDALTTYEQNLATLEQAVDIDQAVQQVSATLQEVAKDEVKPLEVQLKNIEANIAELSTGISRLANELDLQYDETKTQFALMQGAIAQEKITAFLEAGLSLALDAVKIGGDIPGAAKNPTQVADAITVFVSGVQTATSAIEAITSAPAGDEGLLTQAQALMQMQAALLTSYQAAVVLWAQMQGSGGGVDLPGGLGLVSVDPGLAWDNFLARAQAELASIKEQVGSAEAQAQADQYGADLTILAQYGKALNTKVVSYSEQLAQASVTTAQIAAAKSVGARWKELEAAAHSDAERLAALQGLIQTSADSIKRSIYVAWVDYRSSYFYLYFQEPPAITLDMDAAALRTAFAQVSDWVAELLGDSPGGGTVKLPSTNVNIAFQFPIVRGGVENGAATDVALLTQPRGGKSTLTWNIPIGDAQLKGVLPDGGDVAIWIDSAQFFVDGVKANDKGNVIVDVATSGVYQNGYGPKQSYSFVTHGLDGPYAYTLNGPHVYSPWSIDPAVYMTPTPFTQWVMTFDDDGGDPTDAKSLDVELVVAYREAS
jgi:CII-binding regulator of phage lambda lysogenization HflD